MDRRVIGVGVVLLAVGGTAYWMSWRDGAGTNVATAKAVPGAATTGPGLAGARIAPASVSGTVRGEDGAAIPGAAVQLIRSGDDDSDYSVLAGDDGAFTLRDVPAGEYRASASAVEFVPTAGVSLTLAPGEAGTVELVLKRGGNRVTGTVSDISGGPVAGAAVRFAPIHGVLSVDTGESFAAITDPDGAFALNIADGHYVASASHLDYVARASRVELRAGERVVNFALAPGGVVEGRVLSVVDGAPVPGATVLFSREALMTLPGGGVMSTGGRRGVRIADAQGTFRITGLESGVVRLGARGPGSASADQVTVGLGIGEQVSGVELLVDRARTIRGVVRVKDGAPVSGVQVMASGGMGEVRIEALAPTDAAGGFVIEGVLPGAYRLEVVSDRYLGPALGHPVEVGDGDLEGVVVAVTRGAMISGRVEPAARADVGVRLGESAGLGAGAMIRLQAVRSGADGAFSLGPFPPGTIALEATAADGRTGRAEVAVAGVDVTDVVIAIEDGSSVAGRVIDAAGAAVTDATVLVKRRTPNRKVTMIVNGRDMAGKQSPTHEDGSFAVHGLEAGSYELVVKDAQGETLKWARGKDRGAPMALALREAEQREGLTLQVETSDGVISGVVHAPDGTPAADVWVKVSPTQRFAYGPDRMPPTSPSASEDRADEEEVHTESRTMMIVADDGAGGGLGLGNSLPPALTGADGRFEVRGLRRGSYDILAEGLQGSARGFAKGIETGTDTRIDLASLTLIEGTVVHAGAPVESFRVELSGDAVRAKNVRSKDGRFSLHRVDPGRYTVIVTSKLGSGEAVVEVISGKPSELTIELQTLVAVRGRVAEQGGTPIEGAMVVASPDRGDGRMAISIVSDDAPPATGPDGSFELRMKPGAYRLLILGAHSPGPIAMKSIDVGTEDIDLGTITAGGIAKIP